LLSLLLNCLFLGVLFLLVLFLLFLLVLFLLFLSTQGSCMVAPPPRSPY
jgi:hypothetical protein